MAPSGRKGWLYCHHRQQLPSALPSLLLLLLLPVGGHAWSDQVQQLIKYVWTTPIFKVRNAKFDNLQRGDSVKAMRERLVGVAEDGFRRYLDDILPKELEADDEWRDRYESAVGSRTNLGFIR